MDSRADRLVVQDGGVVERGVIVFDASQEHLVVGALKDPRKHRARRGLLVVLTLSGG